MNLCSKLSVIIYLLSLSLYAGHSCDLQENSFDAVGYVNDWREASGLPRLKSNGYLKRAALNHSRYRTRYKTGHYEREGDRGFTGKVPSDRAIYVGYPLRYASENIAEAPTAQSGVESLMTAIYHRFGFLNYSIDEMGMARAPIKGHPNSIYTFVMGNSLLAKECRHSTYRQETSYYYKLCKNRRQKVAVSRKNYLDREITLHKPKFIIYPYANAHNVLPAFYEEHPDPLPRYTMVGNPISVEFHPRYKKSKIEIRDVKLWDVNAAKSIPLIVLYKRNDPNKKLEATQFAFFPKRRLEWGRSYEAKVTYKISSESYSDDISWGFTTKKLPSLIRVDKKHYKFAVKANHTYTLYFKPHVRDAKNHQSVNAQFGYRYYAGSKMNHEVIDSMTIKVCLHGKKGDVFKIRNGATLNQQEVELILK